LPLTFLVVYVTANVLATVDLDNQPHLNTDEVGNIGRYRVLAPELVAAELAIAQESP